ncbi:MAG: hypothetical protein VX768_06225 [Planctomycetota bacterium]|nr:hypothetical protein [Planctomycetota bacterium]
MRLTFRPAENRENEPGQIPNHSTAPTHYGSPFVLQMEGQGSDDSMQQKGAFKTLPVPLNDTIA